ncbi:hypothetical protein F5X68DRAFT_242281 [Plectosphaerella plurivora]|uniref:ER-bound oxygenase mpaB/mpaB'/Rubber oxygenase catalytic domain-containing protein n=1 Tax=Plectosphaerella plurivora TaxID=936078 RepID=A0A9P8V7Z2_9PEZI|nr:hypothetical protein F5X68DRAFT_242281 [Plectosphaerella plurivora]
MALTVLLGLAAPSYLLLVRLLRYRRMESLQESFGRDGRPLSRMTAEEAHRIVEALQTLEFPQAFGKARQMALLKAGGITTMSKLFAATGQNNRRNAGKRAVDTEIVLREAQTNPRNSERYAQAVARMNFLHARYRRAGKITDNDLLHTLGDGLAEIFTVVDRDEWRRLTDVERCAIGVFHKNLAEDMDIPLDPLPSSDQGWTDGLHFARELKQWTIEYEERVARPTETNDQYVRVYVDSAVSSLPGFVRTMLRGTLGMDLDDVMRESLCIEAPGPLLRAALIVKREIRRLILRHLCLPRSASRPIKLLQATPDPKTKMYAFERKGLQPWYVKPTISSVWGPQALLFKLLGGRTPGSRGDRYKPQGYDLRTIGPEPQHGKGLEEMEADAKNIMARTVGCPFGARARIDSKVR